MGRRKKFPPFSVSKRFIHYTNNTCSQAWHLCIVSSYSYYSQLIMIWLSVSSIVFRDHNEFMHIYIHGKGDVCVLLLIGSRT